MKTARGFLSIRAYRLTPEAVKLYKEDDFSPEAVKNLRLPYSRLLQEIPVVIRNSTLVNLLLLELQKKKGPVNTCESQFMDLGTTYVSTMLYVIFAASELMHSGFRMFCLFGAF